MADPNQSQLRRVVWVTGGTRGIGRAIGQLLADECDLALSYRAQDRPAQQAQEAIAERTGSEPLILRGDLSHEATASRQVEKILEKHGRIDALVHCAALASFKPVTTLSPREIRRTFAYSFESLHHSVQAVLPNLKSTRGSIAALSSLGSQRAIPRYGALGAAKAALESYVRNLAAEVGTFGVRANVVSAGLVKTGGLSRLGVDRKMIAEVEARTPLGRLVTADEVAATVRFLISDQAAGVTGQVLIVDGGYAIVAH